MKERKMTRFFCDYCKKSTGQRAAMTKHEAGCTLNPGRFCQMCKFADGKHAKTIDLIAAARTGLDALKELAGECPACILAGIRQLRKAEPSGWDDEGWVQGGAPASLSEFKWIPAVKEFWIAHPRSDEW
jgi:hypothetical protein